MRRGIIKSAFILTLPLLFLQLPLREFGVEPYPAILLPGGSGTVKDEGFITFTRERLTAITADGKRYAVSVHDLLSTVPAQYRRHILRHHFGLHALGLRKGGQVSTDVIQDGRAWLRNRLESILGPGTFVLLNITRYRLTKPTRGLEQAPSQHVLELIEVPLR